MSKIIGKNIIIRIENAKGELYGPGCDLIEGHDMDKTITYADADAVIIVLPLDALDKELTTDTAAQKDAKRARKIAKLISASAIAEKEVVSK